MVDKNDNFSMLIEMISKGDEELLKEIEHVLKAGLKLIEYRRDRLKQ